MKEEIIELFKAKAEMRKLKNGIKTEEDLVNYFFGEKELDIKLKAIEARDNLKKKILKNKNIIVKSISGAMAVILLSGCIFAGCRAMANNGEDEPVDTQSPTAETSTMVDNDYGHQLSQEEVLQIAKSSLERIEKELTSKGAGPMGEVGTPFYPSWFNPEMLATIAFLESTNRATNSDGSPLLGNPVDIDGKGTMQSARGMCQVLPIVVDEINYWLKNTMESDWSYTYEDCDDPVKAMELCILINIRNCKNFFDRDEVIYKDPNYDFKDNIEMQGDCVVASYHYGAGNIINAYYDGTLKSTYLNPNWVDSEGKNYWKKFEDAYKTIVGDLER